MKKLLMILPLALIICVMVGCQDKAAMAELEEFRAQAALEEQNKELAKNMIEEFNKGNVEIWRELCTQEFAYYNPSETTKPMSLEQTIERFQMVYKGFPDFSWNIQELIAEGDKVVVRSNFSGTNEGEYRSFPISGNKVKLSIISILQFKDGKCTKVLEEEDSISLMQQLGMELKLKEEK